MAPSPLCLLLLLLVSFIPYPTAVLGRYGPLRSSAVLYGLTLTLLGATYTLLWRHIVRRKLSRVCGEARTLQSKTRRNMVGTLGYPFGTAVALVSPKMAVVVYLLLAMFYILPERKTRIS